MLLERLRHPVNKEGFIDEEEVFKIAYGILGLPLGALDELTPLELYWLLDSKQSQDKEFYEMTSYAMKVAFVSANTGKAIPLFTNEGNGKTNKVTQEERDNTLALLGNIFEG